MSRSIDLTQQKKLDNIDLKLEERGLRWLEKVARAPHQEPWIITILQFAWAAGPVTLAAAYFGHFFAYREILPAERAFYFIGYSVIAVLLSITYRMVYNLTHGRQVVKDRMDMLQVIDQIPEVIYMTRDLSQRNMTKEGRRIHAAGIMLRKLDLGPQWVATAINDLTGKPELAKQAEQIEVFRRAGLYHRMRDVVEEAKEEKEQICNELKPNHPRAAEAIDKRLNGVVARPHHGHRREPLFLERILSAIEEDNEDLMTMNDVEEMLTLCFELICGREIPYLKIEYTGHWHLAKALDRLEGERNDFRISRARVYSRLKALNNFLANAGIQSEITSATGLSTQKLLAVAISSLDALSLSVREARQLTLRTKKHIMALNLKSQQLEKAMQLYNESHRAYLKQGKDTHSLKRALKNWQNLSSNYQSEKNENLKRSLIISEQMIMLDDENKVAIAKHLREYFQETRLRRDSLRTDGPRPADEKDLTETRARDVAIEIATILDPYIHLNDPQIQRAIESANATSMGNIEPGMSARTKAMMGEAMASAVETSLAHNAERLAQNLIRYYRVPLSDGTINFLVKTYNADKDKLKFIAQYETPMSAQYSLDNVSALEIPQAKESWQIDLYNAKKTINRYS